MLLAVFTSLPSALVILFVYGLCTSTGMVVFSSTVQGAVPDQVRGRVFTLLDVSWNAMRLLSLALGGLLEGKPWALGFETLRLVLAAGWAAASGTATLAVLASAAAAVSAAWLWRRTAGFLYLR